jgi:protein lifeguard
MSCLPSKRDDPQADGAYVGTAERTVRAAFIRKVYTVLSLQLLLSIGLAAICAYIRPVRNYLATHQWFVYIALGVAIACLIPLFCFRTRYPANLVLLVLFTLAYAVLVAVVVSTYFARGAGVIVLEALCLTAIVFVAITTYVMVTKRDFHFLGGFLFAALCILIAASIANFALGFVGARSKVFTFCISVLGALVFTGYLLFDTSMVVRFQKKHVPLRACFPSFSPFHGRPPPFFVPASMRTCLLPPAIS